LGQVAQDDQGKGAVSKVHHVTLTGLTPESTYHFRVHSGERVDDNAGRLYRMPTKATGMPPIPFPVYGQVKTADGQPATGALIRAWLVDGKGDLKPLSTVVDGYGYWSLNLPLQDCMGVELRLQVAGSRSGEAELLHPACGAQPVRMVVLAERDSVTVHLPLIMQGVGSRSKPR
jgi:hypothetical protein